MFGKRTEELEVILNNISQTQKNIPDFTPISWNEITLEPGLKIMSDNLWEMNQPVEELLENIRNALIILNQKNINNNKNLGEDTI